MKRPFWVKGTTPWDTFRMNFNLVRSIIFDSAVTILFLLCFFGIFYVFFYKVPTIIVDAAKEVNAVSDKRKTEQDKCFMMEYAGKKFYKYTLEGHEYWCVENHNQFGFCHSESCHCKTNKVEVMQ